MLTITVDELEHLDDPVAALVWRRWIRDGRARLLESPAVGRQAPLPQPHRSNRPRQERKRAR
jgi:hypothetical protein